jgi:pimeloyl-ACP methyl ester carboxylesterase
VTDPIPGPPIVAVPGLGLSGSVPRRFLARMPRPSRVVELPGFGLPASRSAPRRADDLAQLLLDRALDGSTVERAVLIGLPVGWPPSC